MICLQLGYAGMEIISKVSLNRGMNQYVLVVYRNAIATVVIAPFAIYLERNTRPKLTFPILAQIWLLGLVGLIEQNVYYAAIKLKSPTFSCAITNMLPAMTLVVAVIYRMEKLDIKKITGQAKVIGTIVSLAGAMFITFYKGDDPSEETTSNEYGVLGSIVLIIAKFTWESTILVQNQTLRMYSAPLSLTCLVCFTDTLQSTALAFVMGSKSRSWTIGWDVNLLAAAYAGIFSSSFGYYVQGLVMEKRGPVFVTAFSPLVMIFVAIWGYLKSDEKIYIGGVMGTILILIGLGLVLWGKYKEDTAEETVDPNPDLENNNMMVNDGIKANIIEMQKNESYVPMTAISSAMITVQASMA